MSKKKGRPMSVPPGRNHVRLELDDAQHALLRVMAAQNGMSMAAYARAIVVQAIEAIPSQPTARGRKKGGSMNA